MKVAIFDFDGTLIKKDSFVEFIAYVHGRPKLYWGMFLHSPILFAYKVGIMPNWKAKQRVFGFFFKGMTIDKFNRYCENFKAVIEKYKREDVFQKYTELKDQNADTIIVSASIENWIMPWAKTQGFDKVIGTTIEIDNEQKITGQFLSKNCYGIEKVERISELFKDRDSYYIVAFGDSKGDKELLAFANEGYLV